MKSAQPGEQPRLCSPATAGGAAACGAGGGLCSLALASDMSVSWMRNIWSTTKAQLLNAFLIWRWKSAPPARIISR